MKTLFLSFLMMGVAFEGIAQQPSSSLPPLPDGPLIKRVPDRTSWKVVLQGSLAREQAVSKMDHPIAQSFVMKDGQIIVEQTVDSNGRKAEVWHVGNFQVMKTSNSSGWVACPESGGGDIYTPDFAVSDFSGLDWISRETYAGMGKYQGRDCMIFKGDVSPLSADSFREERFAILQAKLAASVDADSGTPVQMPTKSRVPATAYIDSETRLPLSVTFGNEKRSYQYTALNSRLSLPPAEAKVLQEYQIRLKRLSGR